MEVWDRFLEQCLSQTQGVAVAEDCCHDQGRRRVEGRPEAHCTGLDRVNLERVDGKPLAAILGFFPFLPLSAYSPLSRLVRSYTLSVVT